MVESQDSKYVAFANWCSANGIVYPNQEYPATFDGGLVGVRATAPIKHREAFIYVPFQCLVTPSKVRKDAQLGPIIEENLEWFDDKEGEEGSANTFLIFLLHEW